MQADGKPISQLSDRRYDQIVRIGILCSAFRSRNLVVAFLFVCHLLAQNATPAAEPSPHRVEYPTEHFSIELPGPWKEIDQAIAGQLGSAIAVLMPNAPKLKSKARRIDRSGSSFSRLTIALASTPQGIRR